MGRSEVARSDWCWVLLLCLLATNDTAGDELLSLRQEYNQVTASIDTLVRMYGGEQLEKLTAQSRNAERVPAGFDLVLIFWADDEAEIFLNGFRISDTRLTPTEVVVPPLYLQESNVLRAHCWDTDRVESGFMAGLYLRDQRGGLRQVLVTEEGNWWVGGGIAQERYYAHSQPDIPGARVLWGPTLFGEVLLETRFDGAMLRQAARRRRLTASHLDLQERAMDAHEVVSRLVRLQVRRQELERELQRRRRTPMPLRYGGYLNGQLAFTLGRAGPLAESQSAATSLRLREWAESLPEVQKRLIFRERRDLKGVEAAIPEQIFEEESAGEGDRRADYLPPQDRGPVEEGPGGRRDAELRLMVVRRSLRWGLVAAGIGLILYTGAIGRQWWRLFTGKVWSA